MSRHTRTTVLGAAAFAASLAALAQVAAPPPPVQPAAGYTSAFEGYRPFASEEVGDWRQANETVRSIGGWRAYAREIHGGSPSSAPPTTPVAPAQGHGSHGAPAPSAVPARPAHHHQGHHP